MFQKKFLIAVFFMLYFVPTIVMAGTMKDSFSRSFIPTYSYSDSRGKFGNFEHFSRNSDGQIVYCIEPGVHLYKGDYDGFYDLSLKEMAEKVSLSEEMLNLITLYANFGYGYNGHAGNEWIVATQALIWETLGRQFQFTVAFNEPSQTIPTPKEIVEHMNEIKALANQYMTKPSFDGAHVKIGYKKGYNLGTLNGFTVTNCENCTYQVNGNDLIVTPTTTKSGKINLTKSINQWEGSFAVYYSAEGQNMLMPGNISNMQSSARFDVVSGKVLLKKFDADSKSCQAKEGGSLKGSLYKLYKESGTFVKDLEIDENCSARIDTLELGKYYIKESKPGLNYELDPTTYSFELTLDHPTKELTVYDKMYLGQVKLYKLDKESHTCDVPSPYASLKGAIYGLFKEDGTLLEKLEINDDCSVLSKRNLLLGKYYLKEISAPKGYKIDTKKHFFSITKENADGVVELTLEDEIYKTQVKMNKTYLYFNSIKAEPGAEFEIYYKKDKERITTLTIDEEGFSTITLPYGEYIFHQISGQAGYHFVEDFELVINETTDYEIYISFLNKPYQGSLEFYKIDLDTKEAIPHVFIAIYNELDELVYSGETDEFGKITVENLAYGKYYIIERKAADGYQVDDTRMYFEIKEDKEVVNVVMENIKVPKTLKDKNKSIVVIFITFLLGIGCLIYGKKKEKK